MTSLVDVRALVEASQIASSFEVMKQLRPNLEESTYFEAVQRLMRSGYLLAGVVASERVVAVAGYRFGESLSWGSYLYVDDLVTDDRARSQGHGKILFDWLVREASAHGCAEIHLDSGVQRFGAHRFYLRERMDIVAYHFRVGLQR